MRTKEFIAHLDNERIVGAIRAAEDRSHGEVRVHVTNRTVGDAEKEAERQFEALGMTRTELRNGVLIYVAPRSNTFAVVGDKGIHERCGQSFWADIAAAMQEDFRAGRFTDGIVKGVEKAGAALATYFPRESRRADVNELADDVTHD